MSENLVAGPLNAPAAEPGSRAGRRPPRLVVASLIVAAPGWLTWAVNGHRGAASAVRISAILAVNVAATRLFPSLKLRAVRFLQRWVVNPPVRLLLTLGFLPLGLALLETTGRHSGKPRRTPVGEGKDGDTFWVVAEHGRDASYVRNLAADPNVRVKIRQGLRTQWRHGVAQVLGDDDPYLRQRALCRWHPLRTFNAAMVRVLGTDLITIRISLSRSRPDAPAAPTATTSSQHA